MKIRYILNGFILLIMFFLLGCWKQHDVIKIKSDGTTTFETYVKITEKGFSRNDIDQLTAEFMKELSKAGWKVEKKWVVTTFPYQLKFTGIGNLFSVKNAPDFYKISKKTSSGLNICFIPAVSQGGRSSRSIKFDKPFFGGAKVVDQNGQEITEIQNVLGNRVYKVIF